MVKIERKKQIYIMLVFIIIATLITVTVVYRDTIYKYFEKQIEIRESKKDNVRFAKEYTNVNKNNVYKYISVEDTIEFLKDGTGIIIFSFPECPWCQKTVPILNEVAKQKNIKKIYYYNIKEIRKNDTAQYKEIVALLKGYLSDDEEGNPRVFVPDIYFVKDGVIQGHSDGTSLYGDDKAKSDTYYTDEVVNDIKANMKNLIDKIYNIYCIDSKLGDC